MGQVCAGLDLEHIVGEALGIGPRAEQHRQPARGVEERRADLGNRELGGDAVTESEVGLGCLDLPQAHVDGCPVDPRDDLGLKGKSLPRVGQ